MPMLDPLPSDLSTKQVLASQFLRGICKATLNQIVQQYSVGFRYVWNNPNMTPQQVLDSLGTDAGQFLQMASALATLVATFSPATVLLSPPKTLTVNNDGTVTVGA